jgi:hypothetical protein
MLRRNIARCIPPKGSIKAGFKLPTIHLGLLGRIRAHSGFGGFGYALEFKISGIPLLRRLTDDQATAYQAHTLEVGETRANSGRCRKKERV